MKNKTIKLLCYIICFVTGIISAQAETWTWQFPAQKNKIKASICPVKYGKDWAYVLEMDDSLSCAKTTAEPLISQYQYTDAPTGVKGGKGKTFKGTVAALIICIGSKNSSYFSWKQVKELRDKGWGIANHGYWSTGNHWDPKKRLDKEQFERELFWCQVFLGNKLYDGKSAPAHMVYPNGDHYYKPHMGKYGILSASSTGGRRPIKLDKSNLDLTRMGRHNLDWWGWKKKGGESMYLFPNNGPAKNTLHIDFTHKINTKKDSANYQAWAKRLKNIGDTYGAKGKDNVWSAPTAEIVAYFLARKNAKLTLNDNIISLEVPKKYAKGNLTIKITGISANTKFKTPKGAVLYRKGDTVWITTPNFGTYLAAAPKTKIKRVFSGKFSEKIVLKDAVNLACVRLLQLGGVKKEFKPEITLISPEGKKIQLNVNKILKWAPVKNRYGQWLMFPTLPEEKAPLVKEILFNPSNFKEVEVWAVQNRNIK